MYEYKNCFREYSCKNDHETIYKTSPFIWNFIYVYFDLESEILEEMKDYGQPVTNLVTDKTS